MPEMTPHDRYTVLELKHNLSALDIESIKPWSTEVIQEDRYHRLHEAVVLAAFKLDFVDTVAERERTEVIKAELIDAQDDLFIEGLLEAGIQRVREDRQPRWTHGA